MSVRRCGVLLLCYSNQRDGVDLDRFGGLLHRPDLRRWTGAHALDHSWLTTDQKVGGSNPSERTKVLTRGLPRVVADATEPTLCFRVSRETRESPCQGTHVGPVPI